MSGTKECRVCKRMFEYVHKDREYCSDRCSRVAYFEQHPDYYIHWRNSKKPIHDKQCRHCSKPFQTYNGKKLFCSGQCKIEHHNSMRPTTQAEARICPICGKDFRPMQNRGVGRTYCSPVCRDKAGNDRKRDLGKGAWNPNRNEALARDRYSCQVCGYNNEGGKNLDVHHLDGTGEYKDGNHHLDNLITLCVACHKAFHARMGVVYVDGKFKVRGKIFKALGLDMIETTD